MALSDVTITVNLVSSVGTEPYWFPLFLVGGAGSSADPLASCNEISYTEFSSLSAFMDALAPYTESMTRAEKRTAQELAKSTTIYKALEAMYQQEDHPNKFAIIVHITAVDTTTLLEEVEAVVDKGWRWLVPIYGVTSYLPFSDYVEELKNTRKMVVFGYGISTLPTETYTETVDSTTYTLTDYDRTIYLATVNTSQVSVCAFIGAIAGKNTGSLNYRNVIVEGVTAASLTEDELESLHDLGFMTFVERAGDVVTSQGKSASCERYIDTIDIEDFVVQELIYETQQALNVNDKVPYNNDGIAILENAAASVMSDCCDRGLVAKTDTNSYSYSVEYPAISYVPDEDISSRVYRLGTVTFTVQGAIDKVEITVEMTL